ncbi:Uu.00g143490.m01.CDS01 [Anthostomella pinea]|uniref:Uu.00g143490.m01.CDS01 n=1 Tax=Anthostomella pinea TaxID=933095 RepID=A0AAI8VQN9_9PEZI|nr:Uu.00g143490.m01.CDS01 [Anthostomella pinea]
MHVVTAAKNLKEYHILTQRVVMEPQLERFVSPRAYLDRLIRGAKSLQEEARLAKLGRWVQERSSLAGWPIPRKTNPTRRDLASGLCARAQPMQKALRFLIANYPGLNLLTDESYLRIFIQYPNTGLANVLLDSGIKYSQNLDHTNESYLFDLASCVTPYTRPTRVLAQRLIDLRANVNYMTPVSKAVANGNTKLVRTFVYNGAKIPLAKRPLPKDPLAIRQEKVKPGCVMLDLVLKHVVPSTVHPDNRLLYLTLAMANSIRPALIKLLIERLDIDVNQRDVWETRSPLARLLYQSYFLGTNRKHWSPDVARNIIDLLKVLVEAGADLTAEVEPKVTALDRLEAVCDLVGGEFKRRITWLAEGWVSTIKISDC